MISFKASFLIIISMFKGAGHGYTRSIFQRKKADFHKLSEYGFEQRVRIDSKGSIQTDLIDSDFDEPYTSHLVANATGSFAIGVRPRL